MAEFVQVPVERLDSVTLTRLLEEFASRDGTDYGERETPLEQRVTQLRQRLLAGEALLVFDSESESWDLLPELQARALLAVG